MRKVTAVEDVVHDDLAAFSEQCFGDMAAHEAHATSHQDTLAVNVSRLRECVVLCWERRGGLHLEVERLEEGLGSQRTADEFESKGAKLSIINGDIRDQEKLIEVITSKGVTGCIHVGGAHARAQP